MINVIFHVGFAKTGTTYIQNFLFKESENLAKSGYLYPKSLIREGFFDHGHLAVRMRSQVELEGKSLINFHREIRKYKPKNIIISSEMLPGLDLRQICERLGINDFKIIVLACVRRSDRFFESLVLQDIKVGVLRSIPSPFYSYYSQLSSTIKQVEAYLDVGVELRIFAYSKNQLINDFCESVGININHLMSVSIPGPLVPLVSNPTIDTRSLRVFGQINQASLSLDARNEFLTFLESKGKIDFLPTSKYFFTDGFFLRPAVRAELFNYSAHRFKEIASEIKLNLNQLLAPLPARTVNKSRLPRVEEFADYEDFVSCNFDKLNINIRALEVCTSDEYITKDEYECRCKSLFSTHD